jgi:hypothetical protein
MSRILFFACLTPVLGAALVAAAKAADCGDSGRLPYFRGGFSVTIAKPPNAAFALFDANGERRWDPSWSPSFVHGDAYKSGSIFKTSHGGRVATWLIDGYDSRSNSVSYVVVREDRSIMKIVIALVPTGGGSRANVSYEITALNDDGKRDVGQFCTTFPERQAEWQTAINGATK